MAVFRKKISLTWRARARGDFVLVPRSRMQRIRRLCIRYSKRRRKTRYNREVQALTDQEVRELERRANQIRQTIIEMLVAAGSGHTAGPLGMADIFTALYFRILKHDPKSPEWEDRDRLFLSNGHICPVRYATMAHAGYFPVEECLTLRKFGSRL